MRPRLAEWLNSELHTTAFTFLLPNYFIMLSVAVIFGTVCAARRARGMGLDPGHVYGLALWAFPSALLGARLMSWVAAPWGGVLSFFDPLLGDMAAYGGFFGGVTAGVLYIVRNRLDTWRYLDGAIPGVGLGTFLTRLGCFLDGDDFGSVTGSPVAVSFPAGSFAFAAQVQDGLLSPGALQSLPVHPVQLYLGLNALLAGVCAAWWSRRPTAARGQAFCAYWFLYACGRFGLEYLRGDADRGFVGPLSVSQAVSVPVSLIAAAGFLLR